MAMAEFDYSSIWTASGLQIANPWVQAKDLAGLWPGATRDMLRKRFTRMRHLLGKQKHSPIHVAEVAHAFEMPLGYVVDHIRAVRP